MKIPSLTAGLLAVSIAAATTPAAAQDTAPPAATVPEARNATYIELLGNGLIYSINYDRRFTGSWGLRGGLGALGPGGTIPITVNYLAGGTRHHLDLGLGPLLVFGVREVEDEAGEVIDRTSGAALLGTGTFGYRFQPDTGGFVFRIGLTPLFSTGGVLPWFGLSLGYAF